MSCTHRFTDLKFVKREHFNGSVLIRIKKEKAPFHELKCTTLDLNALFVLN